MRQKSLLRNPRHILAVAVPMVEWFEAPLVDASKKGYCFSNPFFLILVALYLVSAVDNLNNQRLRLQLVSSGSDV